MANKYAAYFALETAVLVKTKNTLDRSDIISDFTNGSKNSLTDLTPVEYRNLLQWIKTTFKVTETADWQNTPENKMRRKIIGYFKSMHYTTTDGKADMNRINDWCVKYSLTHKRLNENDRAELVKIVGQVDRVYKSFIQSVNK